MIGNILSAILGFVFISFIVYYVFRLLSLSAENTTKGRNKFVPEWDGPCPEDLCTGTLKPPVPCYCSAVLHPPCSSCSDGVLVCSECDLSFVKE